MPLLHRVAPGQRARITPAQKLPFDNNAELSISLTGCAVLLWWWSDRTAFGFAMGVVAAVVGTVVIAFIVKAVVGLRPSEDVESIGLDLAEHGEEGYHGA